jgi:hypothetical protein
MYIILLGWGGMAAVILIRRFGRLPVLFWSQVIMSHLFEAKNVLIVYI